jgi:hypothetical protein
MPRVTHKAQISSKIIAPRIDSASLWRYSLAQIPDLVANAIPRFRQTAQSFGLARRYVRRFPANFVKRTAGARARVDSESLAARPKSCPDTKPSRIPFGPDFSAGAELAATSEKGLLRGQTNEKHTSGAKAHVDFAAFTARLKSCPFKAASFSALCIVIPDSAALRPNRFTSTTNHRTGGRRFL